MERSIALFIFATPLGAGVVPSPFVAVQSLAAARANECQFRTGSLMRCAWAPRRARISQRRTPDIGWQGAGAFGAGNAMSMSDAEDWFVREVLPLEAQLMQFLRRSWRNAADIELHLVPRYF